MNWYQLKTEDVFAKLNTSELGLNDEEAAKRLSRYGPNKLSAGKKINRFKILLHQFASPLIFILIIAGIVTFILEEYIDSGVIMAVVVLNAIIGYVQEFKAEESVRALKKMVVPKAKIIRNGKEKEINSEELAPGDTAALCAGMKPWSMLTASPGRACGSWPWPTSRCKRMSRRSPTARWNPAWSLPGFRV